MATRAPQRGPDGARTRARGVRSADVEVGRTDGYLPIESYAIVGNGGTSALVGADGSIDWMCLPERDSPSTFGALLDAPRGGRFGLAPSVPFAVERAYVSGTNVLQSTFRTADGVLRLTDALTLERSSGPSRRELVRELQCLGGRVPVELHFEPRFAFGSRGAVMERHGEHAFLARDGALQVALQHHGAGEPQVRGGVLTSDFELEESDRAMLVMEAATSDVLPQPRREEVEGRMETTVSLWRSWVGGHTYEGPWRAAVERSLLALRALADGATGAISAAATTSLPEAIGSERNYDYRYGWVRDLSFTLDAFMRVGIEEPTQASLDWLLRASRRTHPRVDPVYALRGAVVRSQEDLDLAGYRGTAPVRHGNAAGAQLQLGGFGDLIETAATYVRAGHVLAPDVGERLADIADLLCFIWRQQDSGLWELDEEAHYTTSKVGCWVALQRVLDLAAKGVVPPRNVARWERERDAVRSFVETRLYSERRRSYLLNERGEALDCGTLLAARRGYGDARGERMRSTVHAIRGELHAGGPLLYRYSGMRSEENAFLPCSFWLVQALAMSGAVDEAAEIMDEAVALGNDVGLYSEEMDPSTYAMLGNFPQALTHLALILAAAIIAECS